ncbi:TrlF family AAA-like ATPase [Rhodoferax koreensis]|uniref:TrlF family AAA-like ATPase n=1 Tax=Rhodoferax koreensis TaxID=1842727 RepID=UPI0009F9C787|nr:AAA family ATPase [Rhodoferax koreense]
MADFAHWRKCDFQVHTPRDPNWVGARPLGADEIDPATGADATREALEASRRQWAEIFVDTCVAKGLQAVAITDHHEAVMLPYVRSAAEQRRENDPTFDLWVFPGMELTAVGGVQCLLIFDTDLSEDWCRQAQGRLGIEYAGVDESKSKSLRVTQLKLPYPEIGAALDELQGIRGRYIVLPNVSEGNFSVLSSGNHGEFLRMPYVGGYLDRGKTIDSLGHKSRTRLSGTDKMWSTREIYPIPTSDSRSSDYGPLGANETWIKLAAPTAEAIRQAFLCHRSRIHLGPPQMASPTIVEVKISGSHILEEDTFTLSPELNSIIGGRGSGKSSLLEYIAFAMGRSCFDMPRDQYSGNERLQGLIKDTLVAAGGQVAVTIEQDGAEFVVTRSPATKHQPQIRYPNGAVNPISVEELRALFPGVVYSQGELAEVGKHASAQTQLTDLLQFVSPAFKAEADEINRTIVSRKQVVRATIQALIAHWDKQTARHRLATNRDTLQQRIAALEKTLPALSGEDQAVVDGFAKADAFESQRILATTHADELMTLLDNAVGDQAKAWELPKDLLETETLRSQYKALVETFAAGIADLRSKMQPLRGALTEAETAWKGKLTEMRKARDDTLAKIGSHKSVTDQIIKLRGELSEHLQKLAVLDAELAEGGDPAAALKAALEALREANKTRAERTQSWAADIEELSANMIRATIALDGDASEVVEALDLLAARTGSQQATRLQAWNTASIVESSDEIVSLLRVNCEALLQWRIAGEPRGEELPQCRKLWQFLGDTENIRGAMLKLIDATRLEAISTALAKPQISLFYLDGQREVTFDKASEGQRAAALLLMLLRQPGGPLIVDQPEGDLDNKVISKLTDKLHAAKRFRQLIFASHNANIVVNGSSELVAYMDVAETGARKAAQRGAIDSQTIRSVITETMEGGEKAFKDRYDKYGY